MLLPAGVLSETSHAFGGGSYDVVHDEQFFAQDYHPLTYDDDWFTIDSERNVPPHMLTPHGNPLIHANGDVQAVQPPPYGPLLEDIMRCSFSQLHKQCNGERRRLYAGQGLRGGGG